MTEQLLEDLSCQCCCSATDSVRRNSARISMLISMRRAFSACNRLREENAQQNLIDGSKWLALVRHVQKCNPGAFLSTKSEQVTNIPEFDDSHGIPKKLVPAT